MRYEEDTTVDGSNEELRIEPKSKKKRSKSKEPHKQQYFKKGKWAPDAFRLKVGEKYISRGGGEVKVYDIIGNAVFGSIKYKGDWVPGKWNIDGAFKKNSTHTNDIVVVPKVKFLAGRSYRTADGREAKIIVINPKDPEWHTVGIVLTDEGWHPIVWYSDGITKRPYGACNNLVDEWTEEMGEL